MAVGTLSRMSETCNHWASRLAVMAVLALGAVGCSFEGNEIPDGYGNKKDSGAETSKPPKDGPKPDKPDAGVPDAKLDVEQADIPNDTGTPDLPSDSSLPEASTDSLPPDITKIIDMLLDKAKKPDAAPDMPKVKLDGPTSEASTDGSLPDKKIPKPDGPLPDQTPPDLTPPDTKPPADTAPTPDTMPHTPVVSLGDPCPPPCKPKTTAYTSFSAQAITKLRMLLADLGGGLCVSGSGNTVAYRFGTTGIFSSPVAIGSWMTIPKSAISQSGTLKWDITNCPNKNYRFKLEGYGGTPPKTVKKEKIFQVAP